jgi:hypothetical protein
MAIWGNYAVGFNGALGERTRQAWLSASSSTMPNHPNSSTKTQHQINSKPKNQRTKTFWQRNPLTNQTNAHKTPSTAAPEPAPCPFELEPLPELSSLAPKQVPLASLPMDLGLSQGPKPQPRLSLDPTVYRIVQEWAAEQLTWKKATRQRDQGRALRQAAVVTDIEAC